MPNLKGCIWWIHANAPTKLSCFTEYLESFMLNIMFRYFHIRLSRILPWYLMEVSWPEKFSNFQLGSLWRFASRESRLHEFPRPTGGVPPLLYRKSIPVGRCFFHQDWICYIHIYIDTNIFIYVYILYILHIHTLAGKKRWCLLSLRTANPFCLESFCQHDSGISPA